MNNYSNSDTKLKGDTPNVIIRPASKADAPAAARLMLMAFPTDALLTMGNGISYENLEKVITQVIGMEESIYSFNNILVAELQNCYQESISSIEMRGRNFETDERNTNSFNEGNCNNIVGVIIAYDGAKLHKLRKPMEDLLEKHIGEEAHNWDDETSAGEFYLDSLAVDPTCRGMNIGSRLIEATVEKARKLGHSKVGLLVDLENPKAEKLYTRLGFEFANMQPFMRHTYKHLLRSLI